MKPPSYFRLALFFPYILWGICAVIFLLVSKLDIPENLNFLLMPLAFYVFGILLWFIPYTAMTIGLWVWSRGRSTKSLFRSAMLSPVLLAVLISLETILVSLPSDSFSEFLAEATSQSALVGVFSLVFGYLCVGIAAVLYRFLRSKHFIAEETPEPAP